MSEERSYDEEEIAEILERATATSPTTIPSVSAGGLTLTQLQEIGSEVGIVPARIAEAALAVSSREVSTPTRTFLGAPKSVSRTVRIHRALNDDEWARLVADLRETFDAQGKVTTVGSLRSWTNGNLQVHVEPDADGYRVRMLTVKGSVGPVTAMGLAFTLMSLLFVIVAVSEGGGQKLLFGAAMATIFGGVGLGQIGYLRASLPGWAADRATQMEGLAERIPKLLK